MKFFEEPIAGLKIFLILPNDNHLLPTVKSRLITLNIEGGEFEKNDLLDESKFLKGQIYTRMEMSKLANVINIFLIIKNHRINKL